MAKRIYEIAILGLSFISVLYSSENIVKQIDTTVVLTVDLTGDGQEDSIYCKVTGESWKKPMTVDYKIVSNKTVILSETSLNAAIDNFFGDPNMIDWCEGYIACKKEWYLIRLPKNVMKIIKPGDKQRKEIFDTTLDTSIPRVAQQYYIDSLGYSKKKSAIEAKKLTTLLKKMDIIYIFIPVLPVYPSFPRFYDPIQKKMIKVYGF